MNVMNVFAQQQKLKAREKALSCLILNDKSFVGWLFSSQILIFWLEFRCGSRFLENEFKLIKLVINLNSQTY